MTDTTRTPFTYDRHTTGDNNAPCYLAFDIGGTKISSGLVTIPYNTAFSQPRVEHLRNTPTEASRGGDDLLRRLTHLATDLVHEYRDNGQAVRAIGIGTAGVVDSLAGSILSATDIIPGWTGQRIAPVLAAATGLPVHMVGDVEAHGLGEAHYGVGRGHECMLAVAVGTGIGGALIRQGKVYKGAHAAAGNMGHMSHSLGSGVRCSCGADGHIEPVASGTGLATLYNLRRDANTPPTRDGKAVSDLAAQGDPFARDILVISAGALGETIAGACNLIDPSCVVISGSVAHAGERWWQALREGFRRCALPPMRDTPLMPGILGGQAALIGAAFMASAPIDQIVIQ